MQGGRVCLTKRSPKGRGGREQTPVLLPEPCSVNPAAIWDEGYRLLPGEVWTIRTRMGNPEQSVQRCTAECPEVSS